MSRLLNFYLVETAAHLAMSKAGSDLFSKKLRERALKNWELSKQLPRKAKKQLRKDVLLDLSFARINDKFTDDLFQF